MIKRILYVLMMCVAVLASSVTVYAADTNTNQNLDVPSGDNDKTITDGYNITDQNSDQNKAIKDKLTKMYTTELYNTEQGLAVGINMAKHFAQASYVFCVLITTVVSSWCIGVTVTDLAYIIVPPIRPLLMKRTQQNGTTNSSFGSAENFGCISDSCMEAVHGSTQGGGGGMGGYGGFGNGSGGSDRGVGSALIKYVKLRTKEFIVFILFVLFFLLGLLGRLAVMLFNLFASFFNAIANFA